MCDRVSLPTVRAWRSLPWVAAGTAWVRQALSAPAAQGGKRSGPLRGFTLIEVLVVLAVLAILALIAVPSQVDRIVRGQVQQALALADVAKPPIEQAWRAGLPWPSDNEQAELPPAERIVSQWVRSTTVEDGAIHLRFGQQANGALQGRTLTLRPAVVEDAPVVPVAWICAGAAVPQPMRVHGVDRTDIPVRHLPVGCR